MEAKVYKIRMILFSCSQRKGERWIRSLASGSNTNRNTALGSLPTASYSSAFSITLGPQDTAIREKPYRLPLVTTGSNMGPPVRNRATLHQMWLKCNKSAWLARHEECAPFSHVFLFRKAKLHQFFLSPVSMIPEKNLEPKPFFFLIEWSFFFMFWRLSFKLRKENPSNLSINKTCFCHQHPVESKDEHEITVSSWRLASNCSIWGLTRVI